MKLLIAAFTACLCLAAAPALATDDYQVRDGTGAMRTKAARDIGGKLFDRHITANASGADINPATNEGLTAIANAIAGLTLTLPKVTPVDVSGVFGTSSAQIFPADPARRGIQLQVQGAGSCRIRYGAPATLDQHSLIIVGPTGYFESTSFVVTAAANVICTNPNTPVFAMVF